MWSSLDTIFAKGGALSAVPKIIEITRLQVSAGRQYLHPYLHNDGTSDLAVGHVVAMQTSRDGTVKQLRIFNGTPLQPGQTTKLIEQVFDAKSIQLQCYEVSHSSVRFPMTGTLRMGFFGGWSIK